MLLDELRIDGAVERADQRIRQPRERLAGLLGRHRAGQNARSHQEHVLLRKDADAIEEILIAAGLLQRAVETQCKLCLLGQRPEEARIDHRVHDIGKMRQAVGEPRRCSEHQRKQRDQIRIQPQQRQETAGRLQCAKKPIEGERGPVRIRRASEMRNQDRHQLGKLLASGTALERAMIVRKPAANQRRNLERLLEAHASEFFERVAIVRFGREIQPALRGFLRGRAFEQGRVVLLHLAQMTEQFRGKSVAVLVAEEMRKTLQSFAITRKLMGLLIGDHLQTVLD